MRFSDQVSKLYHTSHYFHDYYFQWNQLPEGHPEKNYQGLYAVARRAVMQIQDEDLRKQALKNDLHVSQSTPGAKDCWKWLKQGKCELHETGRCPHEHLPSKKGVGKGKGKGKGSKGGKGGKTKGKTKSKEGKGKPTGKSGKGKGDSGKKRVYDRKKVCLEHNKQNCHKGASCPKHHNPPCPKLMAGENCEFGEQCLFPHWNVAPQQGKAQGKAQAAVGQTKAEAKKQAKADAKATGGDNK